MCLYYKQLFVFTVPFLLPALGGRVSFISSCSLPILPSSAMPLNLPSLFLAISTWASLSFGSRQLRLHGDSSVFSVSPLHMTKPLQPSVLMMTTALSTLVSFKMSLLPGAPADSHPLPVYHFMAAESVGLLTIL